MREPPSKGILWGVGLVAAALYFVRLGHPPFLDPPEGLHAAIAQEMRLSGDWITPHFNGVRYFDKPPLLYWMMAAGFWLVGPSEWAARFWSALPTVGIAVLTAWLGMRLGSERLGLIAGLVVVANLEVFLFGRLVKPDLVFVFFILLAYAGFVLAYQDGRRGALLAGYTCLGAAILAKDVLGAVGPIAVFALFFFLTRERRIVAQWLPSAGLALLVLIAVPWYFAAEWKNDGFLWYTVVDKHLLNFAGHRVFPDEDVPLTAAEFLGVTAVGFFPWSLVLPWALVRVFRGPWQSLEARIWLLLGLWSAVVVTFFTLSPFKLPHYALPALPHMALLVAKVWDDALGRAPGAPSPRALLVPPLVVLAGVAVLCFVVWQGALMLPSGTLSLVDVHTRNLDARGQGVPFIPYHELRPLLGRLALIFGLGSIALAVAVWRQLPRFGLGALLGVMVAFLPVTVEGFTLFAKHRSVVPVASLLKGAAGPQDVVVHEGALENSASLLLATGRSVKIVDGRQSNLAFGATFPEAREIFWEVSHLKEAWGGTRRVFLLSVVNPERSVVRELPRESVHLLLENGGRWLYSNRPGRGLP
ncbi:MAG: glycosyltransferase family 39 protein [Candidatus Rokubacteria bacterium]|nr:glycosyltransferase family 39 protein [Candidatus Rokubacteria bacterium]